MTKKTLKLKKRIPDEVLSALSGYSPVVAQLLYSRGITTKNEASEFIEAKYDENKYDPILLSGTKEACELLEEHIKENNRICVYTDYDCDGIPGATIFSQFLNKINFKNYSVHIPDRNEDGYGMTTEKVKVLKEEQVKLIVTIDLGITAHEPIAEARKNDIQVILTDHHQPLMKDDKMDLPNANVIVNPKVCGYEQGVLSGTGVIFKVIQMFVKMYGKKYMIEDGWEKWLLDFVALATVADMVPITGENRTLVKFGTLVARKSRNSGFNELARASGVDLLSMNEKDFGFSIVPKVNATSRLEHAQLAYDLFMASNEIDAKNLAKEVIKIDKKRKVLVASTMKEAHKKVDNFKTSKVVVIGDPDWKLGILGLIASRVRDLTNKPCFVWSRVGDEYKGSCRAHGNFNLVELMQSAPKGTFKQLGGHKHAGGFSIELSKLHTLHDILSDLIESEEEAEIDEIYIDHEVDISNISNSFFEDILSLAPFGMGNEAPIIKCREAIIKKIRFFGADDSHGELIFTNSNLKAITFFNGKEVFSGLQEGDLVDIVGELEVSTFRGFHKKQMRIISLG